MTGLFKRAHGGGAQLTLDPIEASILRNLTVQMLELIGPGPGGDASDSSAADYDPLAALFAEGPSEPPEDPALARLFPDAYAEGPDAESASSEFRRFTENDLRAKKRDDALALVRALDAAEKDRRGRPVVKLDAAACGHALGTLNDLRLTLGSRLDVSEDDDSLYRLPDEDDRKPLVMAYLWLGGLQESLLDVLMS
ncbi:DUF2017 domain-containing protein [Streptacidiphilus fuscans]|uniref:DUF2017 domain-containing protein n=1 Tax=Streptacidiphilus fuscans TaxID=2789292 RepID=A0A931FF32_9ACTN|nr:DUF2017 domain-containing protein [Streptacidiphilus fuscans]MBF9072437.1 DUF2017 domain-containing protein [Streptacidiphilus fuscans]